MPKRKAWLMRMPMPRAQTILVESIPEEFLGFESWPLKLQVSG